MAKKRVKAGTAKVAISSRGSKPGEHRGGREKGTKNKITVEFRETVRRLLEDNAANVGVWLKRVAEGHGEAEADPAKALDLLAKLAEYASPKLGRTELTGKDGADLPVPTGWVIQPVG